MGEKLTLRLSLFSIAYLDLIGNRPEKMGYFYHVFIETSVHLAFEIENIE
jgi:hypothetical protein